MKNIKKNNAYWISKFHLRNTWSFTQNIKRNAVQLPNWKANWTRFDWTLSHSWKLKVEFIPPSPFHTFHIIFLNKFCSIQFSGIKKIISKSLAYFNLAPCLLIFQIFHFWRWLHNITYNQNVLYYIYYVYCF